ncbi:MAG TPA: acyl carrier protein [Dongiaceae bacterium]|nr:acyl carrier protein [Dongiaceae bacterium]
MNAANQATEVNVKGQIREFVMEHLASAKGVSSFTDQESLMDSGVIDSLGVFRVVSFLEETFNVRIADEEISSQNLKSIDSIERLVLEKLKR